LGERSASRGSSPAPHKHQVKEFDPEWIVLAAQAEAWVIWRRAVRA
jgi:hypothetical protein